MLPDRVVHEEADRAQRERVLAERPLDDLVVAHLPRRRCGRGRR